MIYNASQIQCLGAIFCLKLKFIQGFSVDIPEQELEAHHYKTGSVASLFYSLDMLCEFFVIVYQSILKLNQWLMNLHVPHIQVCHQ